MLPDRSEGPGPRRRLVRRSVGAEVPLRRRARPAAVMISPDELASLEDTLELLSDLDAMDEIAEARRAHAAGEFVTGDELRARFPAR